MYEFDDILKLAEDTQENEYKLYNQSIKIKSQTQKLRELSDYAKTETNKKTRRK